MIGARVVTPIRSVAIALREFWEVETSNHIRALVSRPLSHSKSVPDTNTVTRERKSSLVGLVIRLLIIVYLRYKSSTLCACILHVLVA